MAWNFVLSTPGTLAVTVRSMRVILNPSPTFSTVHAADVSMLVGVKPSFSSPALSAMLKQAASAAARSSSGSNPEELLAAAEAACFSMALSAGLEKEGFTPTNIETSAACTVEKVGEGFKITRMDLTVTASVPGVDNTKFQAIALATKESCPVSTALKGNVTISLQATLA